MDITIDLDNLILKKDLSGVTELYRELYDLNNFEANIIFISQRESLNLQLPFKQFYKYWEMFINRTGPKNSETHTVSFLGMIYKNISMIVFLMDIILCYKNDDEKIIEYISDITRKDTGFNVWPILDR